MKHGGLDIEGEWNVRDGVATLVPELVMGETATQIRSNSDLGEEATEGMLGVFDVPWRFEIQEDGTLHMLDANAVPGFYDFKQEMP